MNAILDELRNVKSLGQAVFIWGVILPGLLMLSMTTGEWFLAAYYYTLPLLFVGHFLFIMGGFTLSQSWMTIGRLMVTVGALIGIGVGVSALTTIHQVEPMGMGMFLVWVLRIILYAIHAVYLAVNIFLAVWIFRFDKVDDDASEA